MSVIPGGQPVPDEASTANSLASLQGVTEDSMKASVRSKALAPWEATRTNWIQNILGGIGEAFMNGLKGILNPSGWFKQINAAGSTVRDGQVDLIGRTDLLDPLLNYGSVYCPRSPGAMAANAWYRVNLTAQISTQMRGCSVYQAGGIVLEKAGLWDIRGHIVTARATGLLAREVTMDLRVVRPDGTTFSSLIGRIDGFSALSIPVIASVQTPEPNYRVEVWMYSKNYGLSWGYGPTYSRLTVQQIQSTSVPTGDEDSGVDEVTEG